MFLAKLCQEIALASLCLVSVKMSFMFRFCFIVYALVECKDSVKIRFSEGKENIFSFLSVRFLGLPMKPISWEATQKPILCIIYIHCNEQ